MIYIQKQKGFSSQMIASEADIQMKCLLVMSYKKQINWMY